MNNRFRLLALVALVLSGCTSRPAAKLTVGAAASFTVVLEEIGPAFEQLSGFEPTISIGSTGQLAQQIENGAPFDVFMSADATHIDALIEAGLILPESRTLIAYGRLVVIGAVDQAANIDSWGDLAQGTHGRIAIANPEHAPYGQAALQALENSGVLSSVENRIIYAETVRQAAQMVESGNAEIGIVAASVLTDRIRLYFSVPPSQYDPIEHIAGVLSSSELWPAAVEFISFLTTPSAQEIFESYGFEPVESYVD
jgi:molybdate transport system substrate-binding protein